MGWWNKLARDAKTCLICEKKCGKVYTTVKYRYEDEKVGEVFVCEECSKEYDIDEMNEASNGESI